MIKLTLNQKSSLRVLHYLSKPCIKCGNHDFRFDNHRGWIGVTIICKNCKNTVKGKSVEEALEKWNNQNKVK